MSESMSGSSLKIAGIAGSLRRGSYNRMLLAALGEVLPKRAALVPVEIGDLPLYNEDLNNPERLPAAVAAFKQRLSTADAVVFATPEYNYSIPGVLKNALDWASRPVAESPLRGKPAGIMGASQGAFGTVRAQLHLRHVCVFLDLHPFNVPEVLVRDPAQKFDAHGVLTDEPTRRLLQQFGEALVAWTLRLRGDGAAGR